MAWTPAENPVKATLRKIAERLRHKHVPIGPTLIEICRANPAIEHYVIEAAEVAAGEKHLAFQKSFFARQDETGRKCSIFPIIGANRSAKSFTAGWLCFAKFLRDYARSNDWFWCVGQTFDSSVTGQQRELWEALPRSMFNGARGVSRASWDAKQGFGTNRRLILPTRDGGTCLVEFRSGDQAPKTFEQAKLRGVWCDERLDEKIFNRLLLRLIDRDGWLLYSDIPEQYWHVTRLKEAEPAAGVNYVELTIYDNANNLPPGIIEQRKALMTVDEQRMRLMGEHVVMEGLVYKEFIDKLREAGGHLVQRFRVPAHWPRWRMIDYGGSSPTACLWAAISDNEHIYLYREYYFPGPSVQTHAKNILLASGDEEYRCTYIDPAAYNVAPGNTLNIAEQYEEAGIAVQPGPRTNQMGEHAMVQRVRYRYENRTIWVFSDLTNLRREKRSWKYKCDDEGRPIAADAFENENNHLLDCEREYIATLPTFAGGSVTATVAGARAQHKPARRPPSWRDRA